MITASYRLPSHVRQTMLAFAIELMDRREPDFILGGYMERWHLAPRGDRPNAYIHRFRGSDSDRALHDHPYDNITWVLRNEYREHFHVEPFRIDDDGRYKTIGIVRREGEVIERPAPTLHRVEVMNDDPVITLFFTGERAREWGFEVPGRGWVDQKTYHVDYAEQIAADVRART